MRSEVLTSLSLFMVGTIIGGELLFVVDEMPSIRHRIFMRTRPANPIDPPGRDSAAALEAMYQRQIEELKSKRLQLVARAIDQDPSYLELEKVVGSRDDSPGSAATTQEGFEAEPVRVAPVELKALNNPSRRGLSNTIAEPSYAEKPIFPPYEVLHAITEYRSSKIFAEVLVPSLYRKTPIKELRRAVKAIATQEGFDNITVYRTRAARQAHYSMAFADAHPRALKSGLLGTYSRGRFRLTKVK